MSQTETKPFPQATLFPFLFFFGTSLIVRSTMFATMLALKLPISPSPPPGKTLIPSFGSSPTATNPESEPSHPNIQEVKETIEGGEGGRRRRRRRDILGGKLCFNLSALSVSLSTSVYRNRRHRTLNLICCDLRFRFIRAAVFHSHPSY